MSITAPDILDKAAGHMRERASTYDSAKGERSMGKAVAMFNACHGTQLTEEQGWHLMELVKHVRYFTAPDYHADSVEDGAAYAALRGEAGAAKMAEKVSAILPPCKACGAVWDGPCGYGGGKGCVKHQLTTEPASEIDDESERIQAIGQNGPTGEHYVDMWKPMWVFPWLKRK